jgi:putative sterol carrier protein
MAESVREIFEPIGRLGHVPRLRGISSTMRFDVVGAGSWHVAIDDGVVTMTESSAPADCVLEFEEETLRRIASGQLKPLIAFMQGLMTVQGEPATALHVAELFAAMAPSQT